MNKSCSCPLVHRLHLVERHEPSMAYRSIEQVRVIPKHRSILDRYPDRHLSRSSLGVDFAEVTGVEEGSAGRRGS